MSNYLFFQGVSCLPKRRQRIAGDEYKRPSPVTTLENPEAENLFHELFSLTGIPHSYYRQNFLQRRLNACLRFLGVKTVEIAIEKLRKQPELAHRTLGVVLLGVTDFYRDVPVFTYIQRQIIPLLKNRQNLRVWSAACSDGQELYSIATLLAKADLLAKAELLGTDCRAEAIAKARQGTFAPFQPDRPFADIHAAYFSKDGKTSTQLQQNAAITWKQADLFRQIEKGPWDLLLWRNMSIYLAGTAAEPVWRGMVQEMRPGGFLIAGKADYPPVGLGLVRIAPCIYQKKGGLGE